MNEAYNEPKEQVHNIKWSKRWRAR